MWLLLLWSVLLVVVISSYFKQKYSRFSKYGVKSPRPMPFFGTLYRVLFRIEHFSDNSEWMYHYFSGEKFFGSYEFTRPLIWIRDLDLLKKITVKDFDHFVDHRSFVDEENEPLFGKNLFSMKGQTWRDMRSTLSPAFTSSKIRAMVPFMLEVGDQMIDALRTMYKKTGSEHVDIDIKDLATRYANDVIASCAFGLKVDSNVEVNKNNEFYLMGKAASTFGFWASIKFLAFSAFPNLMKKLKLSIFREDVKVFFKTLVLGSIKDRETNNIVRPDMIHLLMEAKKGKLTHDRQETKDVDAGFATVEESSVGMKQVTRAWDDMELVAQAVLFFIAGFETVASVMSFLLLELAIHPDVQEKLYQEIKETHAKTGGKIDYNAIQKITYLDKVVSEALRLWPPVVFTDRVCIKDYNLGKANDKAEEYIIRKGEAISIPVYAIHRNPEFYPNPDKFDPERFSPENVHNVKPFTYLPFGLGPRNCIGSRFALSEVKIMVYQLLLNMKLSPGKKLQVPLQLSMESFNLRAKGGHWLQIEPRT